MLNEGSKFTTWLPKSKIEVKSIKSDKAA